MAFDHFGTLSPELVEIQAKTEAHARSYGLDFFPTVFEMVTCDQLNAIAAYGGFPTRYPHWRFGMQYEQLARGYEYGLQKIYELVINNDPCYAYLLSSNTITDQKLVMAHVYGHCDFFKNNHWFSQTNRKMMDQMANHGTRIRRHMDLQGVEEVESFIDVCLSLENLIDIHSPFIQRTSQSCRSSLQDPRTEETPPETSGRFAAKHYMDPYVNPPRALAEEALRQKQQLETDERCPTEPTKDCLRFLLEHAPLKPWQLDVLSMIRDEAYYFAPQAQTKIMNEGWASYWHSTIMTQQSLNCSEVINYCDHHSGTLATSPGQLNPYKLGIELFRDIEDRWNKGRFGQEYEECDDLRARREWDTQAGQGREKIFEVRRVHNDLTFVDAYLTLDFCRRHKLFSFGYNSRADQYEIESREFPKIKQRLLFSLTSAGRPIIAIRDSNYRNRKELFLEHRYSGAELKISEAKDTLVNLHTLWKRPVHIETVLGDEVTVLSYDGSEHGTEKSDATAESAA